MLLTECDPTNTSRQIFQQRNAGRECFPHSLAANLLRAPQGTPRCGTGSPRPRLPNEIRPSWTEESEFHTLAACAQEFRQSCRDPDGNQQGRESGGPGPHDPAAYRRGRERTPAEKRPRRRWKQLSAVRAFPSLWSGFQEKKKKQLSFSLS